MLTKQTVEFLDHTQEEAAARNLIMIDMSADIL